MSKRKSHYGLNEPLKLNDHSRPKTRREFIAQGFMAGAGVLTSGSLFNMVTSPAFAQSALVDITPEMLSDCGVSTAGAGKIPFICFDLAGGANTAGSNVLVGQPGGQEDFLSTAGYSKQGLPGDMAPPAVNLDDPVTNSFVDRQLGLAFHSTSQMLAGITEKAAGSIGNINGAVIAARSENDTGNNPHNPMYAINRVGANGSLIALSGSRASESGGNSLAPMDMIDPEVRPTKIDRASDVIGLAGVTDAGPPNPLSKIENVAVAEAAFKISEAKMDRVDTGLTSLDPESGLTGDQAIKRLIECGYMQSADISDRFDDPNALLNPDLDPDIVGPGGIFTSDEYFGDSEFRKTAAIMKLVVNGFAGAGTVTMGGYDYHTGERATGETRDLRAGRCIGACLDYARRIGVPIMVYVFSDGSVFSDGTLDNSELGGGKGVWTGDNQQTAAPFFLVYNPAGQPVVNNGNQQIGYMRASGDVETSSSPAANNVNRLVELVALNYMALHGEQNNFSDLFGSLLGNATDLDNNLTAFEPIVTGTIS